MRMNMVKNTTASKYEFSIDPELFFVAARASSTIDAKKAIEVPSDISMFMLPKRVNLCHRGVRLPGRHMAFISLKARMWKDLAE